MQQDIELLNDDEMEIHGSGEDDFGFWLGGKLAQGVNWVKAVYEDAWNMGYRAEGFSG